MHTQTLTARISAVLACVVSVTACRALPPLAPRVGGGGHGGAKHAPSHPPIQAPVGIPNGSGPVLNGCPVFPATNPWNTDVSKLSVRADSASIIANIQGSGATSLHADFGGGGAYGIPFVSVPASTAKQTIHYTAYGNESDPGPFPIPPSTPIEGGSSSSGDRHVIALQQGTCHLYELYRAFWNTNHWDADAGVNWNLRSNALRPLDWTSADAAGLPIFPGLARFDETAGGVINHALRVTFAHTQRGYVLPATHYASSSNDPTRPAMGMRLRLKANFDLSPYHGASRVLLIAMQRYGLIVADNGSNWFVSGASDARWDDSDLNQIKKVPGSAFEVVNTGPVHTG